MWSAVVALKGVVFTDVAALSVGGVPTGLGPALGAGADAVRPRRILYYNCGFGVVALKTRIAILVRTETTGGVGCGAAAAHL